MRELSLQFPHSPFSRLFLNQYKINVVLYVFFLKNAFITLLSTQKITLSEWEYTKNLFFNGFHEFDVLALYHSRESTQKSKYSCTLMQWESTKNFFLIDSLENGKETWLGNLSHTQKKKKKKSTNVFSSKKTFKTTKLV